MSAAVLDPTRTAARERLGRNFAAFERLRDRAQADLGSGRAARAAAWVQTAADQAWFNPGGHFADAALEDMVLELAGSVPRAAGRAPHAPGDRPRVLHVVTQAYQTGGSTQFVASWADQDTTRDHHVCLTRQGPVAVPAKLTAREGSRLTLERVDTVAGLLRRAARLRTLARTSDLVLVHAHPYDVVPGLAFTGVPDLPPVTYVNHADHVFWLGTSYTSVLLNMRRSGAELAVGRRGVDPSRCATLARPLDPRGRTSSRTEAKQRLGLAAGQVLVVTAADASKYCPVSGPSLLDLVLPTIRAHPDAVLLAAGPEPDGEWAEAERSTSGRVRALGLLDDPSLVQQAADVYLDSFPFSSLTSLLEVGSLGTPVVTYAGHPAGCDVFGADTPEVEDHMHRPTTPAELETTLAALLDDPTLRTTSGAAVEASIASSHTGTGWRAALDEFVRSTAGAAAPGRSRPVDRREDEVDVLVLAVMERTSWSRGPEGSVRSHLSAFPTPVRVGLAAGLVRRGARPAARDLVPDHLRPALARARAVTRPRRAR
ncbi:hypothetical protein SAMN04488544_0821 [Microlunatus sagamiharensis]|uniref:Uncharacterized protein n=1 Tax=Microlunatus sagamiharensis TaxID=546874 RepID=A0A1H2LTX6_9ACTN|nr:hypothetical protein [Microlunatus sagamiharensis]SDU84324.1 hypothetical protein SAMN04488544_0821 [Microlunatus sagamiharensis]